MPIQLEPVFEIGGNSPTEKALASLIEVQVKSILMADNILGMSLRATATAQSIERVSNAGEGLYRIPQRTKWGSKYNSKDGVVTKQEAGLLTAAVKMDQKLVFELMLEEFDINRFEREPDIQGAMVASYIKSQLASYYLTLDGALSRAIITYCTAQAQQYPDSNIILDMTKLDEKTSVDAFYTIKDWVVDKVN